LEPIHHGHLDVHENSAVGSVWTKTWLVEALLEHVYRLLSVDCSFGLNSEIVPDKKLQSFDVEGVVIDNQNSWLARTPSVEWVWRQILWDNLSLSDSVWWLFLGHILLQHIILNQLSDLIDGLAQARNWEVWWLLLFFGLLTLQRTGTYSIDWRRVALVFVQNPTGPYISIVSDIAGI
jgi:hypothetical protein